MKEENLQTELMIKWVMQLKPHPKNIGFPELFDPRVREAALKLVRERVVSEVFTASTVPEKSECIAAMRLEGWSQEEVSKVVFMDLGNVDLSAQEKGDRLSSVLALNRLVDILCEGKISALVAGACLTTAAVARCTIKKIGLKAGLKTLTSGFLLERGQTVIYFSDCGIVIEPTPFQLIEISEGALSVYKSLTHTLQPTVAFLSFSTAGSAVNSKSTMMAEAAAEFAGKHPELPVIGEVQFDAAWDQGVFQRKVSGRSSGPLPSFPADIFIFPDIGSANIAYKIAQRMAGFKAYGPIIQGARLPICDLSRGSTVDDIFATALITLLQAETSMVHLKQNEESL